MDNDLEPEIHHDDSSEYEIESDIAEDAINGEDGDIFDDVESGGKEDDDDMFADNGPSKVESEDDMFADSEPLRKQDDMSASESNNDELDGDDIDINYYNRPEDFEDGFYKNKKQPKIESFKVNKDEEFIDEEGNHLPKQESDEEEWMNDYHSSDIKKARKAQKQREERLKNVNTNMEPIDDHLSSLIEILDPAETPLEALARLNKKTKKESLNTEKKSIISKITDSCSVLINKSMNDIYDLTKEEIMRLYQGETGQVYSRGTKRKRDEEKETEEFPDYGEKIWLFKWIDDDEVNGPFSDYEMNYWKETYFDNKVVVKKIDDEAFIPIATVEFSETHP